MFKDSTAVIVFCYSRPSHLNRTLDAVLKNLPDGSSSNKENLMFFVSQDGSNDEVTVVIEEFLSQITKQGFESHFLHHPALTMDQISVSKDLSGFAKLAGHYKWALDRLVEEFAIKRTIILEDDMEIAGDFFEYFAATAPLLEVDDSLLGVSAWNDNGQTGLVSDNKRNLY